MNLHWPPAPRRAPTNAWLSAPDSALTDAPAPDVSIIPTCAAGSTCKLGGQGVILVEYGAPPNDLGLHPYVRKILSCYLFYRPPPPPFNFPRTTKRVPTPSLQTGGGFYGIPDALNIRIAWNGHTIIIYSP